MSTLEEVCDTWFKQCVEEVKFLFGAEDVKPWPGICWSQRSLSYLYTSKIAEPWHSCRTDMAQTENKHGRAITEVGTHAVSQGEIVENFVSGTLSVLYKVGRQMLHDEGAQSEIHWIHRNQHIDDASLKQFVMASVFVNVLAAAAIYLNHHQTAECFDVVSSPPIVFWRRAQRKLNALNMHSKHLCASPDSPAECIKIALTGGAGVSARGHMALWGESYDQDAITVVPLQSQHRMLCACVIEFNRSKMCDCSECKEYGCHVCKMTAADDVGNAFFKDITRQPTLNEHGLPDPSSIVDRDELMRCRVSSSEESKLYYFNKVEVDPLPRMHGGIGRNTGTVMRLRCEKKYLLECNCIMCVLPKLKMHMMLKLLDHNTFRTIRNTPRDMYNLLQSVRLRLDVGVFKTNRIGDKTIYDMSVRDLEYCQVNHSKEYWMLMCETSAEFASLVVQSILQWRWLDFVQSNPNSHSQVGYYHHIASLTVNKFCAKVLNGPGGILAEISDLYFTRKIRPFALMQLTTMSFEGGPRFQALTHHHANKLHDDMKLRSLNGRHGVCQRCKERVPCVRNGDNNVLLKFPPKSSCCHLMCRDCVVKECLDVRPYRADTFKCPFCSTSVVRDDMVGA